MIMIPVVWAHIIFGTIAVLAGGAAFAVRKGGPFHRKAGAAYFWSMLIMAAAGAVLSLVKPQMITLLAAVFTVYLVVTSRAAFNKALGRRQYAWAMFVALAVAAAGIGWGLEAQFSETGLKDGYAAENYYFFGVLGLISMGLDANAFCRKGLSYKHRVARHLWRMCFSYFIAAGSLFTGPGATAFPEAVRASGILDLPEPIILLLMLFWLGKTLIGRRKKMAQV